MPAFGGYGGFPLEFGGEESALEVEHEALLDALSPGWDVEDPVHAAEVFGYATALTIAWAVNRRLASQGLAMSMLENLPVWEEVLRLRPSPTTPDIERRRRVAGRLRVFAKNALGDIHDACERVLGPRFVGLHVTTPATAISYWPGVNPGPPGLEWSSSRVRLGVEVTRAGTDDDDYNADRAELATLLDSFVPSWMTFAIGEGSSFVVNIGIVGSTFL